MLTLFLRNITKLDILDGMEKLKIAGKFQSPLPENQTAEREG